MGGALEPVQGATAYWAPEVAEEAGRFYLYYSMATEAGDEHHRLRVATADSPGGPFVDSGKLLMPDQGFSIDPNPFRDPKTGQWYLFFATDYIEDEPHGTGVAVVKMKDMLTAEGPAKMVTRATQDWQIYERGRMHLGRTWEAWYTVEGPCAILHDGRYWCLYSGGRWSTEGYGVGFAVAEHPMGPWRDDFAVHGPVVLKGIAEKVIGPGHNSITLAPDRQSELVVYHAWDETRSLRRMCMDPLLWTAEGPRCDGPSTGPRVFNGAA
jgi:GH43 family beta-xylosidase